MHIVDEIILLSTVSKETFFFNLILMKQNYKFILDPSKDPTELRHVMRDNDFNGLIIENKRA